MSSFIISGSNLASRGQYVQELLDRNQTEIIHLLAEKTSISIKQIQDLAIPLSISTRIPRIVWIEEANLMTVAAQNSLLKMLEEPPTHTTFYLTCHSASMLLPTIRSRCQTIDLGHETSTSDPHILADLKLIMAMTSGDRLSSIVKRDRSETIVWLSQIEQALAQKMNASPINSKALFTLAKIAKITLESHRQLLANCSVGLVTQSFYLLLPHTHSTK